MMLVDALMSVFGDLDDDDCSSVRNGGGSCDGDMGGDQH